MWTYKEFLILVAIVVTIAMAVFVWLRQPKNPVNIFFLLACLNVVGWEVGIIIFRISADGSAELYWGQLIHFFAILIPLCFYVMFSFFPAGKFRGNAIVVSLVSLLTIVWLWLVFSEKYISSLTLVDGVRGLRYEWLFLPYVVHISMLFLLCFFVLGRGLQSSRGIIRSQYLYMFLGLFGASGVGSYLNLFLVGIGDFRFNWLGPLSPIIMMAFIAYAIIAHRLFDIRVIIRRTVVFAGLSVFSLGIYAAIMFAATALIGGSGRSVFLASQFVPNMVAVFAIALGFDPLRKWLSKTTDTWLFKADYDKEALLAALSRNLANAVDLIDAVESMIEIMTTQMRLASGAAILVQPAEEAGMYELKQLISAGYTEQQKRALELKPKDALVEFFQCDKDGKHKCTSLVVVDELERQYSDSSFLGAQKVLAAALIKRLRAIDVAVAIPLYIARREPVPTVPGTPPQYRKVETFIGIVVLGEKKSGDAFTAEDLRLLEIVASQTAGAVEKSRLFEEDQLKSEFVAVASHELLTPTAAMEGYLSMILDEGLGKVDKQARTYLEMVYSESKRLAALVKDLLNVSRIERGKILVNPEPIVLDEVVEQVLASLKFRAEERKISILFKKAEPLPKVMADKDKLVEVFVNLIGNSIKYTPEGGKVEIVTEVQDGFVAVCVKDNGIGMKPEDAQHLFSKFFRASNSDQTGQGGTGLGLYITKNVIELMGGTITVKTALGKGSAFTFTLPVVNG